MRLGRSEYPHIAFEQGDASVASHMRTPVSVPTWVAREQREAEAEAEFAVGGQQGLHQPGSDEASASGDENACALEHA